MLDPLLALTCPGHLGKIDVLILHRAVSLLVVLLEQLDALLSEDAVELLPADGAMVLLKFGNVHQIII